MPTPSVASRSTSTGAISRKRLRYLDILEVAYAVYELAALQFPASKYGPMPSFKLIPRDGLDKLLSAIETPRLSHYRDVYTKAACLFRSLIKNHPLNDGNKRLAVVSLVLFLRLNGVDFKKSQDEIVDFALEVAAHHGNYPLTDVTKWIRSGCRGRPRKLVRTYVKSWEAQRLSLMVDARRTDMRKGVRARVPGRRIRLPYAVQSRLGKVKPTIDGVRLFLMDGPADGTVVVVDKALLLEPMTRTTLTFPDGSFGLSGSQPLTYLLTERRYRNKRVADWVPPDAD